MLLARLAAYGFGCQDITEFDVVEIRKHRNKGDLFSGAGEASASES